jgi:hypothetical protein
MVIVVPIYEEEQTGVYYNSAAVIDADGKYLGKYRKTTSRTSHRLLGKVLFPSGQSWLSVLRYGVRTDRRVHLLRPSLSRRRALSRIERCGDHLPFLRDVAV